jgi:hypothetical protein
MLGNIPLPITRAEASFGATSPRGGEEKRAA